MKHKARNILPALLFAFAALALAGCETTEGFGEDVENLGEGIEDAAE